MQRVTSIAHRITLRDTSTMPIFGLGCWAMDEPTTYNAMASAIAAGYRLFDTAQMYRNETMVGKALKDSGLPRHEYFVVTKLADHGYESAKENLRLSLERLGLEYVDLYLIHSHRGGDNVETWRAFTELKREGLTKSIGVSNFNIQHLEPLMATGLEVPAVNQFEIHPWNQHKDTVKFCREHNIAPMGYCPLARGRKFTDGLYPLISIFSLREHNIAPMGYCPLARGRKFTDGLYPLIDSVASKYNKTKAQVILRWAVQSGFITIPKSEKEERIIENGGLFDWCLSEEEMEQIDDLDEKKNCSSADLAMGEPWST